MFFVGLLIMFTFGAGSIDVSHHGVSSVESKPHQFSYDAVEAKGKRKLPAVSSLGEDQILDSGKRAKLTANTRDLVRNFAILGWMTRRHLDYVASFDFHAQTDDQDYNSYLERKVAEWSKPKNFSRRGRSPRETAVRMVEARAVIDGDFGWLKLNDGRIQGIEGDRIRDPKGIAGEWVHGVRTDDAGAALAYALHKRTKSGLEFERVIPDRNMFMHGYFDREDQTRGISPLSAALNPLRDFYENSEYALAKMKVSQLFAMVLNRAALEAAAPIDEENPDENAPERKKYKINFGAGPVLLDMDPGDEAKFLESATPSTEFKNFALLTLQVGMKSLDIPYSFFDESHTNFFGSRGAWLHYERACKPKRFALASFQDDWFTWRATIAFLNGEFKLPNGITSIADIPRMWVPLGMPWWKPSEEINGDIQGISAGINNPERICRERNTGDVYENLRITGKVIAFAKVLEKELSAKYGVDVQIPLSFAPQPIVQQVVHADEVQSDKKS